ncbi:MAG: ABC transporter ATP-binding protein [Opitutales bacterium]|nr:ABC transporter ATP-binding protein [Opitutales bacterium]
MKNSVLSAQNLKKTFTTPAGTIEVLRDVNLAVASGESVSVRGESGAGKTTLLQILGGLDMPDSGELLWNGERITKRGNAFLAKARTRLIGYVFQFFHLVPELTALENVLLAARIAGTPLRQAREEAKNLLTRVGLAERMHHLPTKLSGGECQRVAIARALINRPPLILADEPTGNLDERTGEAIMQLIIDICREQNTALLLVTHNLEFAERTDRRLVLRHGILEELS